MYEILIFFHILGVFVSFVTLAIVCQQKNSECQKVMMMACFCSLISIIAYLFEIQAKDLSEMIISAQFGYIGKCYLLVLMLIFAKKYCKINMPIMIIRSLFIFYTFILLIILTCRHHTFYYKSVSISNDGFFPYLETENGIGYNIYMGVTFLMVIYYCAALISQIRKSDELEQKRLFLLLLSGILPTIMMILYITGFGKGIDFTPCGIILSCLLIVVNVINYGLLDTMDVAKDNIIKQTSEGVVIVDSNKKQLYCNPAAEKIADKLRDIHGITDFTSWIFSKSVNQFSFEVSGRHYIAKITPLTDDNRNKGYLIWIYDHSYIDNYENGILL